MTIETKPSYIIIFIMTLAAATIIICIAVVFTALTHVPKTLTYNQLQCKDSKGVSVNSEQTISEWTTENGMWITRFVPTYTFTPGPNMFCKNVETVVPNPKYKDMSNAR